ncbi:ribosomal protein L7/L12 [Aeoliella sp. ICT_H6.2]|uniref:Ribosomal protein L7/L12 n=1 Tax=Aeoliella straminimaris TaxID=2954799 RepID=A0A9X2F885_9BACT|nr:ribosomal protein L7/L12 [Aeoliella straminimaris]MCO6043503.1 ribosomal protein L7/L12 [Aeoliella straminimaris]
MSLTDEKRDQINEAIFRGQKIEAIKIYRESTGEGLKESKEFIETLTDSLREEYPDRVPAQATGCGAAALLLCGAVGASVWWCVA